MAGRDWAAEISAAIAVATTGVGGVELGAGDAGRGFVVCSPVTGPAWVGDTSCDGATGFGVRTLPRLLFDVGRGGQHQVLPGHADALEQPAS